MSGAMPRPCGWLPDPAGHEHRYGVGAFDGGLPDEGGLSQPIWDPTQQGNSCTGAALANLGYGLTGERYSYYHCYHWGLVHDHGPVEPLPDFGVSLASVLAAARDHGLAMWESWNPQTPGFSVTGRPPALSRIDAQRRNVDVTRITSDATTQLCHALERQYPGALVVTVDEAFDAVGSDGIVGPERGVVRGSHMINAWNFRVRAGRLEVRCPVHWGRGFGERGCVWIDESRIERSPLVVFATGLS